MLSVNARQRLCADEIVHTTAVVGDRAAGAFNGLHWTPTIAAFHHARRPHQEEQQ